VEKLLKERGNMIEKSIIGINNMGYARDAESITANQDGCIVQSVGRKTINLYIRMTRHTKKTVRVARRDGTGYEPLGCV
jgi:hypothetical protein